VEIHPGTEKAWKGIKKTLGQYILASSQVEERLQVHLQLPGSLAGSAALAPRGLRAPRGRIRQHTPRYIRDGPAAFHQAAAVPKPRVLLLRQLPAPAAPVKDERGEGKWPFCGFFGIFFFILPAEQMDLEAALGRRREKTGFCWQPSPTEACRRLGRSGEGGGEQTLQEAVIAPAKKHVSPMSETRF